MLRKYLIVIISILLPQSGAIAFIFTHSALPPDTGKFKNTWLIAPSIAYMPETSWQFGISGKIVFKLDKNDIAARPSVIYPPIYYTLNDQFFIAPEYMFIFKSERYILDGKTAYLKYPQKYFGIGKETPDSVEETISYQMFRTENILYRKIVGKLFAGAGFLFTSLHSVKRTAGGILDTQQPPGYDGSFSSGILLGITFDNRDNLVNTKRGNLVKMSSAFAFKFLGSSFMYQVYKVDLRTFFSPSKTHILAMQVYGHFSYGDVPFKDLAEIGGDIIMRGYYQGRFRDRHMLICQAESRFKLIGRFGMAIFAGIGNVEDEPEHFKISDLKYSGGAGLRMAWVRKINLNMRVDCGLSYIENKIGVNFYFSVGEAF